MFTLYLMLRISPRFILLFLFIITTVSLIVFKANQKTVKQRNLTRDIKNEWIRKFVKIMMSKFEILQNNKVEKEITELKEYTYKSFESEKKKISSYGIYIQNS